MDKNDILSRLRRSPAVRVGVYVHPDGEIEVDGSLLHQAADEIERLRSEVADAAEIERMACEQIACNRRMFEASSAELLGYECARISILLAIQGRRKSNG
jgi:hypothetical protein